MGRSIGLISSNGMNCWLNLREGPGKRRSIWPISPIGQRNKPQGKMEAAPCERSMTARNCDGAACAWRADNCKGHRIKTGTGELDAGRPLGLNTASRRGAGGHGPGPRPRDDKSYRCDVTFESGSKPRCSQPRAVPRVTVCQEPRRFWARAWLSGGMKPPDIGLRLAASPWAMLPPVFCRLRIERGRCHAGHPGSTARFLRRRRPRH